MTKQIAVCITEAISPAGVGVVIEATYELDLYSIKSNYFCLIRHMCMTTRGVQKSQSKTITSAMLGVFREDPKTREEFLTLIKHWSHLKFIFNNCLEKESNHFISRIIINIIIDLNDLKSRNELFCVLQCFAN